jgi:hypothetical protein
MPYDCCVCGRWGEVGLGMAAIACGRADENYTTKSFGHSE